MKFKLVAIHFDENSRFQAIAIFPKGNELTNLGNFWADKKLINQTRATFPSEAKKF